MAKDKKRISINALERIVDGNYNPVTVADYYGVEVTIKRSLTLKEMLSFVDDVVSVSFDNERGFIPEIMDFAIRSNMVLRYTNFSLPDNIEKRYELLYNAPELISFIFERIDNGQFTEMVSSIRKKVQYVCNVNVSAAGKEVARLVTSFDSLTERFRDVFGDMQSEDLGGFIKSFSALGDLDEERLAAAIMKYRNDSAVPDTAEEEIKA